MEKQRKVPLFLQHGKQYVNERGHVVTVRKTERKGLLHDWPFECDNYYYLSDGSNGAVQLVRPVYVAGEKYVLASGDVVELAKNTGEIYPLRAQGAGQVYAKDGRYCYGADTPNKDLLDYAPAEEAVVPTDPWIGKRVRFDYQDLVATGTVIWAHPDGLDNYAVKLDNYCHIAHTCGGLTEDGFGWYVEPAYLVDISDEAVPVEKEEAGLPEVPTPIEPISPANNIGRRVRFPCAVDTFSGVIKAVRGDLYAVELDAEPGRCVSIHSCDGLAAPNRGFWLSVWREDIEFLSDADTAETQPKADLATHPVLDPEDRALVWEAYLNAIRYNRTEYTIERIVKDMRTLRES